MLKNMVLVVIAVSFATSLFAAKVVEGFEDKTVLKKWELEGDVVIAADQKHAGKSALKVPAGASAALRFSPDNSFGTVSMWIYDSCVNVSQSSFTAVWNGPHFGLINSDDDKALIRIMWRAQNAPPSGYCTTFTADNQMFSWGWGSVGRKTAGWNKWTFNFPDDKTIGCTFNDEKEVNAFADKLEFFPSGANGIYLNGGQDIGEKNETFYYDDIEIDVKAAPKAAPAAK